MASSTRFGLAVPPFAYPGAAFFRTPAWTTLDPAAAVDAAVAAERLGYDSIWVADHLFHGHDGAILEGWTTLAFIAGRTSRIALGSIHLAQPFRGPAMIAKTVGTLDALSGGRLIFFYDWGYVEPEVKAYGLPLDPPEERTARIDEGLALIEELWQSEGPVSFAGRFYQTSGAICRPRPLQRPRPPLWLGEVKDDAWLELIARRADGWNSAPASPARLAEKLSRVHAACRAAGRDPAALEVSLEIQVLVASTDADARARLQRIAALPAAGRVRVNERAVAALQAGDAPLAEVFPDWLIGTPMQIADQIRAFEALGVRHFMLWFVDFPSLDGLRMFAETVIPEVRK